MFHQTTNTANRLPVEQQGSSASQELTQKKFDLKIADFKNNFIFQDQLMAVTLKVKPEKEVQLQSPRG